MNREARTIAAYLERIARDLIAEIQDLSDEVLNRPLPFADTNTLFAVATHTVGMGNFGCWRWSAAKKLRATALPNFTPKVLDQH